MRDLIDKLRRTCRRTVDRRRSTVVGHRIKQWWPKLEPVAVAAGLALLLSISGCASMFACTTKASYDSTTGAWSYESCKDQTNFKAEIGKSVDGTALARVETTATTPEAAIAAALQLNLELQKQIGDLLKVVLPLATKAMGVP